MSSEATVLMAALLVGHYLGDFTPLATGKMQDAKAGIGPPGPIAAHAAVHTILVIGAVALVRPGWMVLAVSAGVELSTHFAIDFVKMRLGRRHPALRDPTEDAFWRLLGLDQLLHLLVLLGIAAYAL